MGFMYTATVYIAGYLLLIFVAICLACGLYFLAELAEEHIRLTKKLLGVSIVTVLVSHVLFFVTEPGLPQEALGIGFVTHLAYGWLFQSFPSLKALSPSFLVSAALLVVSHYLWITHFTAHYHQASHVVCFFVLMVWVVPFGFFISLSVNETVLPDRQAQEAEDAYSEGGRTKNKSGLVSAFNFLGEKRDDLMPSMAKRV
jgi:glucose uptake protein GlcU|eukprot:Transcript_3269.p2 GENE.Transcript_3269~~Transcript_3269.p2  ORF type:complete len:200 (-),score=66.29 Transcript_3269:1147-1746(-)